jgi:protein-disulfide isomerase
LRTRRSSYRFRRIAALVLAAGLAGRLLPAQEPAPRGGGPARPPAAAAPAEGRFIDRVKFDGLEDAPAIGRRDAPVTVVAFIDYQCPYCARAHESLDEVTRRYGDSVRIVFKHNPLSFHPDAELAAQAALAANDLGGFEALHRKLIENQKELDRDHLVEYAAAVGIERVPFEAAIDSGAFGKDVKSDIALAERIGVNATPYFFINGRPLRGAKPVESFARLIDEEITGPAAPTRWVEKVERQRRTPSPPAAAEAERPDEDVLSAGSTDAAILKYLAELHRELRSLRSEVKQLRLSVAQLAHAAGRPGGIVGDEERAAREPIVVPAVSLDDDPVLGSRDAPVGIVEFADYQCPYSRKMAQRVIPGLKKQYIETKKVLYVFRDAPLEYHAEARKAAVAANCAGKQGKYWEMHDALFAAEGKLGPQTYAAVAQRLGLDLQVFVSCLADPHEAEEVEKDFVYAQSPPIGLGVTPTLFVGRIQGGQLVAARKLSGVQTLDALSSVIETLLR